jgi:hypothetical protein
MFTVGVLTRVNVCFVSMPGEGVPKPEVEGDIPEGLTGDHGGGAGG